MNGNKIWERPWSSQEIIENAENWSLAGDAALLNTIKAFANDLLTQTDALNDNIDNLLQNLDELSIKLDISQNEFQSLKNTQFIESRVYDEDEALDGKENDKIPENQNPEKSEDQDIDKSLTAEIKLLDKYYDMVEISVSDSEEDEVEKSFVLQPKDIYEDRELPPLIGSDEWYKNWLEDEPSDIDSQKSSEVYSESDSDDNLPKDLFNGSETSSELDFSHQTNESRPVANSTFKDSIRKPESVASSKSSEDLNSLPAKAPISNKTFAEQLAAKLDSVISREENVTPEINTRSIQPPKSDTYSVGLFADEPPPLSDSEDKTMTGIFSGGKNLFDDDDNEDDDSMLWRDQKKPSLPVKKEDGENANYLIANNSDKRDDLLPKSSQVSKGLFDSDNSDDDLFAPKVKNMNNASYLQSNVPVIPLFSEEPPKLEEKKQDEPVKKKPIGGVSIFGNQDIGSILKQQRQQNNNEKDLENKSVLENKNSSKPKDEQIVKKVNLFDDDDEDLFKKIESKPKSSTLNLFDDTLDNDNYEVNNNNNKILKENKNTDNEVSSNKVKDKPKVLSLFDDDDESNNEDDIFSSIKTTNTSKQKMDSTKNISLFSDEDEVKENTKLKTDKNKNISLFDDDSDINTEKREETHKNKQNIDLFGNQEINGNKNDLEAEEKYNHQNQPKHDASGDVMDQTKPIDSTKTHETNQENNKLFEQTSESQNLFGDLIKNPADKKPKKISLFDDNEDDDEDDLFSNVNKKLDFKLFEDPESLDDMFSIKQPPNIDKSISANVENAEIKKTGDIVTQDNAETDTEEKVRAPLQFNLETNSVSREENSTDEDSVKTNNDSNKEEKRDVFNSKPERLPPKPQPSAKPKLAPSISKSLLEPPPPSYPPIEEAAPCDPLIEEAAPRDPLVKEAAPRAPPVEKAAPRDPVVKEAAPRDPVVKEAAPRDPVVKEAAPRDPVVKDAAARDPVVKEAAPRDPPLEEAAPPPPRPVVHLFGSTPPPDDDDWDTKSDHFSDTEDFVPYRLEASSQRSNLFDNEPPSLNEDYSSGIVIDQSNTRIDAYDSSFNPYAHSSRRLSSDIFSDQQSQDSFFLTKNRITESSANPSLLAIIPEDSKMTTVDVTPSGDLEEFSTAEAMSGNNASSYLSDDVFMKTADETSSNSSLDKGSKDVVTADFVKQESTVKDPEAAEIRHKTRKEKEDRVERSLTKIASITEMLKNQSPKSSPEKKVSPGKLKPTLNINVNALLPGFSQPKIKSLTKSPSPDKAKDEDDGKNVHSPTNSTTPITPVISTPDLSPIKYDLRDPPLGVDVTDGINILPSITKERVRNPAKRKPSTRRGRQEALRASLIEDTIPPDDTTDAPGATESNQPLEKEPDRPLKLPSPEKEHPPKIQDLNKEGKDKTNTEENTKPRPEKYSAVPCLPLVTKTELEKKILSKKANPKPRLFDTDDLSDQDDDLFKPSHQKKTTENLVKDKDDLFVSLDVEKTNEEKTTDDDGLFGKNESKLMVKNDLVESPSGDSKLKVNDDLCVSRDNSKLKNKSNSTEEDSSDKEDLFGLKDEKRKNDQSSQAKKTSEKMKKASKKSLFADSSSDDDLFSGSSSSRGNKKTEPGKRTVEKKIKPRTVKKLENVETEEDPLLSLLK